MLTLWPPSGCWNLLCRDLGRAKGICVSTCPLRTKALLNELGKEVVPAKADGRHWGLL